MRPAALSLLLAACGAPSAQSTARVEGEAAKPRIVPQRAPASARAVVPRGEAFTCTATKVWDGDGPLWCAEGPRLRLAGIAAREMDGTCRPGHPCPEASAEAAKAALVDLMGGQTGTARQGHALVDGAPMRCVSAGGAVGSRTAAWCALPDGRGLSCAMVASGTVVRWPSYDPEGRLAGC